jgi:hypothetical protein
MKILGVYPAHPFRATFEEMVGCRIRQVAGPDSSSPTRHSGARPRREPGIHSHLDSIERWIPRPPLCGVPE